MKSKLPIPFLQYFYLGDEKESFDELTEKISAGSIFKGTNLWVLVFAIFLASLGLNVNSPAVIIGAMLVSPLMGPIMGLGYAAATNHFSLLKSSAKNFGFAVVTALATSTLYFIISPIHEAHSELLARTNPNVYDVLIALFGGLAGMFGSASKMKGNVLPGVAIATALMPPLCTAGYGISDLNPDIFLGAAYLFLINTVFIAWATYLTVRILKYPKHHYQDPTREARAKNWIGILVVVTLVPSIYFAYSTIQANAFRVRAERFVQEVSQVKGNYLIRKNIDEKTKVISLSYAGSGISRADKDSLNGLLEQHKLQHARLDVKEGIKFLDAEQGQQSLTDMNSALINLEKQVFRLSQEIDQLKQDSSNP